MKNALPIIVALAVLLAFALVLGVSAVWMLSGVLNRPAATVLIYEIDAESGPVTPQTTDRLIRALQRRLGRRGRVSDAGGGRIEVGLFTDDPQQVDRFERMLARAGTIEFRILANEQDHAALIERAKEAEHSVVRDSAGRELARWTPVDPSWAANYEYPEIARRSRQVGDKGIIEVLVVIDEFNVTGGYLQRVSPSWDHRGAPCVNFRLDTAGGHLFRGLTAANLPDAASGFTRKLGIILDGALYSAPAIQSTISRDGQITGEFTQQEVDDLCNVLNAGSLPAPIRFVGSRPGGDQ
jgi:SecD/SecF fusion protein